MIPDGNNRIIKINGDVICYRRMLRFERTHTMRQFLKIKDAINDEGVAELFLGEMVRQKIQWVNGSFSISQWSITWHDQEIVDSVLGHDDDEEQDDRKFEHAVKMRIAYPHLLNDPCGHCQKYIYNPLTGKTTKDGNGQPYARQPEDVLLCQTRDGCPKGSPETEVKWNSDFDQTYEYDQFCRSAGQWPDDPIVLKNKGIIDRVRRELKDA